MKSWLLPEGYIIEMNQQNETITIKANTKAGAFYGAVTILMMDKTPLDKTHFHLPTGTIKDAPRFAYRGLMVDVGRNFIQKEEILKLIDRMSLYKMNRLHLHLSEDEGWRLEIPGLPELTKVINNLT